jgi:hypothetical protein
MTKLLVNIRNIQILTSGLEITLCGGEGAEQTRMFGSDMPAILLDEKLEVRIYPILLSITFGKSKVPTQNFPRV